MKKDRFINYTLGGEEWIPRFIKGIDPKKCSKCAFCTKVCPAGVFVRTVTAAIKPLNKSKCIGCGCCERLCKDEAITCAPFDQKK